MPARTAAIGCYDAKTTEGVACCLIVATHLLLRSPIMHLVEPLMVWLFCLFFPHIHLPEACFRTICILAGRINCVRFSFNSTFFDQKSCATFGFGCCRLCAGDSILKVPIKIFCSVVCIIELKSSLGLPIRPRAKFCFGQFFIMLGLRHLPLILECVNRTFFSYVIW